jgi:transcriptional regulator with XRE-family HTH domain
MGGRKNKSAAENQFSNEIGRRIEEMRRVRGISAAEFSNCLQIYRNQLYRYESGSSPIPVYVLVLAARRLGVPLDRLIP